MRRQRRSAEEIRDWQLSCRVDRWIDDLARMYNPIRVGLRTMVDITSRRFTQHCAIWTDAWRVGRWRNTNALSDIGGEPSVGYAGVPARPNALRPLAPVLRGVTTGR